MPYALMLLHTHLLQKYYTFKFISPKYSVQSLLGQDQHL